MDQASKTTHKRVYDGERAREVLNNEAFAQAFADIQLAAEAQANKDVSADE